MDKADMEFLVAAILAVGVINRRQNTAPPNALAAVSEFQNVLREMHDAKLTGKHGSLRFVD